MERTACYDAQRKREEFLLGRRHGDSPLGFRSGQRARGMAQLRERRFLDDARAGKRRPLHCLPARLPHCFVCKYRFRRADRVHEPANPNHSRLFRKNMGYCRRFAPALLRYAPARRVDDTLRLHRGTPFDATRVSHVSSDAALRDSRSGTRRGRDGVAARAALTNHVAILDIYRIERLSSFLVPLQLRAFAFDPESLVARSAIRIAVSAADAYRGLLKAGTGACSDHRISVKRLRGPHLLAGWQG